MQQQRPQCNNNDHNATTTTTMTQQQQRQPQHNHNHNHDDHNHDMTMITTTTTMMQWRDCNDNTARQQWNHNDDTVTVTTKRWRQHGDDAMIKVTLCYRHWLALHSDAKREVPKVPEITKNPKVLSIWTMIAYALLFLWFYCLPLLLSSFSIVPIVYCSISQIGSTGLLTLLSCLLLSQLLLSRLLIVLIHYTALNRHSIHSSTFLYRTL